MRMKERVNSLVKHPGYNDPGTLTAATVMSYAGSAATVLGTVASQIQGSKAADAAEKAAKGEQRLQEYNAQRERVSQLRESRIRKAQVISSAAGEGVGLSGTSGVTGAVSGITAQTASNIGNTNIQAGAAKALGSVYTDQATAQGKQQMWNSVSNLGQTIFSAAGGSTTLFGGNTSKKAAPANQFPGSN